MFGLQSTDIEKMNQCFAACPAVDMVVLYGSRAKGNYRHGSDIDLTIIGNVDLGQLLKLENELDDLLLPYKIDLSIKNTIGNPSLLEHIDRVGKVFYAKNHDLVFSEPPVEYKYKGR